MRRRFHLTLLMGVLSLSLFAQKPLSGQIGLQEVTSLRFEGNREFPDEVLRNSIITRETECRSFIFKVIPFCLAGAEFSLDPYYLNDREFRRDHARVGFFYYLRGFRETAVDTVLTRPREGEVQVTFHIQEGVPIRVVELGFPGAEELPDSSFLENLPIQVGEPLSLIALDATRDTLETRMRNGGYWHAAALLRYLIPRETPYEAHVSFDVFPGPLTRFGPLTVDIVSTDGTEPKMEEDVVLRMLPFREGDVYQENLRFVGQRNLYNLDIFRSVEFTPEPISAEDSILPWTIEVHEGDLRRVRTGGGLSTAECLNFEASWNSRNFFGGARRLQITGRVANVLASSLEGTPLCNQVGTDEYGELTGLISADFIQPYFFSPRNAISASVFVERRSIPDNFVREALGMSLGLTRNLTASSLLGLSFSPQLTKLDAAQVFFCSAYLICDLDDIQLFEDANRLSPVAISMSQDRRDQALSPTRGYSAVADLEYAGDWTGSEFRYTRIVSEATWHTQGPGRWILGARLRGGWVSPAGFRGLVQGQASSEIVHPEKRLFAGGSNSVRGFPQNRLGPRVLHLRDVQDALSKDVDGQGNPVCTPTGILDSSCDVSSLVSLGEEPFTPKPTGGTVLLEGSLEVRVPFVGPLWEAAAFLDFGEVWGEQDQVRLSALEWTPGFGVRYFSPIGPIRVDLAYRFSGGEPLQVVTSQLEPYDPLIHREEDELKGPGGVPLGYVRSDNLVLLGPMVNWGDQPLWSASRFQLHLSIGQAF